MSRFLPIRPPRYLLASFLTLLALLFSTAVQALPKKHECSAEGQPPCPVHYRGPICDKGLGEFKGICRPCGGEGEKACPKIERGKPCSDGRMQIDGRCYAQCGGPNQKACRKIKRGYPCHGSYEPDAKNYCRPCGGDGQKACRALKSGKQCQSGLGKIDGKCYLCGSEGQRACPALKAGRPCNDGLTKVDGKCWKCGRENERACPGLKPGRRCERGLAKFDGWCRPCGGPNERACPKLLGGYPCKGQYAPDRYQVCKPCGGPGEKACRAMKKGRQCDPGFTARGGHCEACGDLGQQACRVTDKGSPCKDGLKRDLDGICRKGKGYLVREAGLRELKGIGVEILSAVSGAAALNRDTGLKTRIANQDDDGELPDNGACPAKFRTMSVGLSGEVGVGFNVEGETGLAWRCGKGARGEAQRDDQDAKNAKWYTSTSMNFRAGGGVTGTVTFGWWMDEVNRLRGKSHGYVLDLVDAVQLAQALKASDFAKLTDNLKQVEPDVAIGLWFERRDEDGDGDKVFEEVGRFLGFTMSFGASMGADIAGGGTYVKAKTNQKCDTEMRCAEGVWAGDIGGKATTLYVDRQSDNQIYVSINDAGAVRYKRKTRNGRRYDNDRGDIIRFRRNHNLIKYTAADGRKGRLTPITPGSVEGIWAGEVAGSPLAVVVDAPERNRLFASINNGERKAYTRGRIARRTYKSDDGDVLRFRKNYTLLKFETAAGDEGQLTPGKEADVPTAPAAIDVLGKWDFYVKGRRLTEEFIEQRSGHVIVRRTGSDLERRYDRSGENAYNAEHGGTFRFVSATRAIWVSPDGQTVFQLERQ